MPLIAWSGGLAGLAYTLLALRLVQWGYARAGRERARMAVLAAVLLSALWGGMQLAWVLGGQPWLWWLGDLADLGRYAAWLAFLLLLLRSGTATGAPPGMRAIAPLAVAAVGLQLLALALATMHNTALGDPARLTLLGHMALPVLALVVLEQVFRNVEDDARWSIKPLCLGLAGLFLFDLYLYAQAVLFRQPDADALAIRGTVHAAVVPLLAVSAMRRNDWATRVRLSPRAAFHSAALLAVGLYLLFLSGVGYYVRYSGGDWGRALQQGLVFVGLVSLGVLAFSGSARAHLRVLLGKHFFHYRFDYREEWLRFTRTLSGRDGPQEVGPQIIRGLADMLESPGGALWTQPRGDGSFSQTARWNMAPTLLREDSASPLCQLLATQGWVINLQEHREHPERYGDLALPQWLRDTPNAWLVIPLTVDTTLIGFCVLANARTPMEVNWEVNDLLKTAGQQAASFLAQAQATEALLEARKFEAFNRMSAFVAHDLKNIVTQLALLVQNARRLGDNPEFQKDMLMTIDNAVERMRHMLLQLRQENSTPGPGAGVDLAATVQRIADQCRRNRGQTLDVQCTEALRVRGHAERLERTLGHLVHNAIDATEHGGTVWVRLERSGAQARICIGDSGRGMSAHFVQSRLFKPFQSTKPAGMGIGAYECYQYVQELGGTMEVESAEGQGTRVTLQLPLLEHTGAPDLADVADPTRISARKAA